ncbi:MAG TPA: head maturation protease, ClpP-related [Micromonosporaceae bacterium]
MTNNRRRPVRLQNRTQTPPAPTRARDSWYRIENRTDEVPSIWLYDEVGLFGVGAAEFTKDLRNIRADTIDLHINSPGGDVFDGVTIMNALKNHPARVNVHVDGLAASAASFIMMAGDSISIARNAQVMVHEGHAVCAGDSRDMRKCADLLDKVSDNIADVYAQRTGHTVEHWRDIMREETWYTADEAVQAGLADKVSGATKPTNTWDLSVFMFAGRDKAPDPFEVWAKAVVDSTDPDPTIDPAEIAAAPIVDLTGDPPGQEPDDSPPDEAGFFVPDIRDTVRALSEIRVDMDLLRAAVQIGLNDVPAPDPRPAPPSPAEEPAYTYLPDVRRALKGAAL